MKRDHISRHLNEKLITYPSMLQNTINAIANIDIMEDISDDNLNAFNINEKLKYNSVKKYAPLINEYKAYHHKINSLYDELEIQGSLKKHKILSNIRGLYLKARGTYAGNTNQAIDLIRENSDNIIDDVVDELTSKLEGSGMYDDDITLGVDLVVVDAFMRCKILEEPV